MDPKLQPAPSEAPEPVVATPVPRRGLFRLSPLGQRRWRNFRRNGRAYWSLWIFLILFGLSLCAKFLANDQPILVSYRGEWRMPIYTFYSEADYGGDLRGPAGYQDIEVECLIRSGGIEDCFYEPEDILAAIDAGTYDHPDFIEGWMIWPPVRYSYDSIVDTGGVAPGPPNVIGYWGVDENGDPITDARGNPMQVVSDGNEPADWRFGLLPADIRGGNLLGTDDTKRDVVARVIYGFQLSIRFTLLVTGVAAVIGILAGAVQGYFGGWTDLIFQRALEIWSSIPSLYVIIILLAILGRSFWIIALVSIIFGWPALVGVVRAEFLRARNFEYVRAARALGVGNMTIMFRHMLPNAMVATLTLLPFLITGNIATLATLDFLGFGLPSAQPSLGELTLQGKENLQAPWLGFTAFFTFAIMLSLLVFIFEGVRDAFDPRKTFS